MTMRPRDDERARSAWMNTLPSPEFQDTGEIIWTPEEWRSFRSYDRAKKWLEVIGEVSLDAKWLRHCEPEPVRIKKPPRERVKRVSRKRTEEDYPLEDTFIYDPGTGQIKRRHVSINVEGTDKRGYKFLRYGALTLSSHRLAWYLTYGIWPEGRVKWINGDVGDNRIENLRVGSNPVKRYQAQVSVDGARKSLGYFDSKGARDAAVLACRGA